VKRLISFTVAGLLVLLSGSVLYAQVEEGALSLSLEESIDLALKGDNSTLEIARLNLEKAGIALEEAKAANLLSASPTNLKQAEIGYMIAEQSHELAKKSLIQSVQSSYYNLMISIDSLQVKRKALDLAAENLKMVQDKLRVGSANQLSLITAGADLAKASEDLIKAESVYEKSRLNFLKNLQLDGSTKVTLREREFPFVKWGVKSEDLVSHALESRVEISQAKTNVEMAELEVELADNGYTAATVLKKAQIDAEKAKVSLDQQVKNIAYEVQGAYLDLLSAEKAVATAKENLSQAEENYRTIKINVDAGALTKDRLDSAEINLMSARLATKSAITGYNITRTNLMIAANSPLEDFSYLAGETNQVVAQDGGE
jgi:outer membrane protein TolC